MSVGEVSRKAGVGRSTFYEHFRDKDEVLRQALQPILVPLANAAIGDGDFKSVEGTLEHISEQHNQAVAMLNGPTRIQVEETLADLILTRFVDQVPASDEKMQRLESARLAGAQVGVIRAWLMEEGMRSSAAKVARMLIEGGLEVRARTHAASPPPENLQSE